MKLLGCRDTAEDVDEDPDGSGQFYGVQPYTCSWCTYFHCFSQRNKRFVG